MILVHLFFFIHPDFCINHEQFFLLTDTELMPNSLFIYNTVYENTAYFTRSFPNLLKLLFERYRDNNFRFEAKNKN